MERRDLLPNLQLMEGPENINKRNDDFDIWLADTYPKQENKKHFLEMNYIPSGIALNYSNFLELFDKRRGLLREKLENILIEKETITRRV